MKRFLICAIALIFVIPVNAQTVKAPAHKYKMHYRIYSISHDTAKYGCVVTNRLPLVLRLKKYPFSRAAKIVLVSFPYWAEPPSIVLTDDTLNKPASLTGKSDTTPDTCFNGNLNITDSVLNYSSLIETKTLNQSQINRLSALFFNLNTRSGKSYHEPGYSCFMPRNAIVFYDKKGKIFDYLEVCFECHQTRAPLYNFDYATNCIGSMDVLKQFFIDTGIKYGTLRY